MHALRNLHTALVVDGLIVETQPISAQPRVLTKSVELGTLDMREWVETIGAVDERFAATIAAGLYEPTDQRTLTITSTFDEGHDCLQIAGSWQGTSIPPVLARRLQAASDPVDVEQQIRLRLFRRLPERV